MRRERPPRIVTCPTPLMDSSWRRKTLSANSVVSRSVRLPESAMDRTGVASGSSFSTMGWSISRGRSARTRFTLSRTSCAAMSTFFSRTNVTKICEMPSDETDWRSSMPAIVLIDSSIPRREARVHLDGVGVAVAEGHDALRDALGAEDENVRDARVRENRGERDEESLVRLRERDARRHEEAG